MNKKKACIESLAALEPNAKMKKQENSDSTITIGTGMTVDPGMKKSSSTAQSIKESGKLINPYIFDDEITKALRQAYSSVSTYNNEDPHGIQLNNYPFQHCVLPNFFHDNTFITQLETELKNISLQEKNNDLYKFSQSSDLKRCKSSTLKKIRSQLELMKDFLSNVTSIPLNSKIDLFCSHYKYTDVLLCHDDELEGRRIAFIYYLVPETWNSSDGGALDLFDTDDHNQPKDIVKSIVPQRNNFVFFEVSVKSFHQVAEILSEDKTRLSLSGWFHGPPIQRPLPHIETQIPAVPYGNIEEKVFYSWLNPLYLAPEIQNDIRKRFEEDSQIELNDFLQEEKYQELLSALQSDGISWNRVGPHNKNNFLSAHKDGLPSIVLEYLKVIHSDAAFLVLSNLTGLKLHPLALGENGESAVNGASSSDSAPVNGGSSNPRCRSTLRRWQHGNYTLAHDTDPEMLDFALDSMLYIGCDKEWSFENGGYTSYIAKGEDEELLSVGPSGNNLALVYRDKDTLRFVKHLNHRVTKLTSPSFYEINCVYYE